MHRFKEFVNNRAVYSLATSEQICYTKGQKIQIMRFPGGKHVRHITLAQIKAMKLYFRPWFLIAATLLAWQIAPLHLLAQRPLGADVSGYQPANINWTPATNAGVRFGWSKATEGTGYVNPNFAGQMAGATAAGIYMGAYHYARPGLHPNITGANSADSEAAYFWSVAGPYIKNGGSYFMPMLDWEDVGTSGQPSTAPAKTNGFTAAMMSAWVNEWCNAVSNSAWSSGVIINPVVYSGSWYSAPGSVWPGLDSSVTNHPNTMSGYPTTPNPQTGAPSSTTPWPSWTFWQYADTNWSGGDSDVYYTNFASLVQKFVIGGTNSPAISLQPTNLTRVPGSNATFSVRASGLAPLSFQWLFDGTNIPGATSSNYTVAYIQLTNAGGYSVLVSNSYAIVPSSTASLSVLTQLTNGTGCILAPPNMVNWWPGEGNGLDIYGANSATPQNGVAYVAGRQMLAFHFDGATGYLTDGAASINAPWTACMWINRQNAPGTAAAIMGDGAYELKLEQYNGTRQVGMTHFGAWDANFGVTVPQNTWTHVAFVSTSSGTSLYINGALSATLTNLSPCPRGYIGASFVSSNSKIVDYMLGSLDEIMIFNRALSASEISAISAAGSAGLVRAPEFTGTTPLGPGQFQLNLRGKTGKNITLYRSPDLLTWPSLGAISNPTGATTFTDNSATNSQGFYRASQ